MTPRLAVLTPGQRRVLGELVKDGPSNRTIARRLNLSEDTVKTHLRRIYAACQCGDRGSLIAAILHGQLVIRTNPHPSDVTGIPQQPPKPLVPIRHGSLSGYRSHCARHETPCDECRPFGNDHMAAMRELARINRAAAAAAARREFEELREKGAAS